jgi:hypothetical protein
VFQIRTNTTIPTILRYYFSLKSKLTFTHISALTFWINNIMLKRKKLLEYAMFNQNIYSIAMRTTYEH